MRWLWLVISLSVLMPSAAEAEDSGDPRAIMRQAAAEQADTTPPVSGPPTEANGTARSRADGEEARVSRSVGSATAEAHRAAVSAARAAAAAAAASAAATRMAGSTSAARAARGRNSTTDAAARGAAGVAREHGVRTGAPNGPPTTSGGRP